MAEISKTGVEAGDKGKVVQDKKDLKEESLTEAKNAADPNYRRP